MLRVTRFDHLVLRIGDLDRSLAFYGGTLGLTIEFLAEYHAGTRPFVSVRVGDQFIDLVPDPTYDPALGRVHGGLVHCCIEVDAPLIDVIPALLKQGIEVLEDQPLLRMGARGVGPSIYVTDPDGYVIELKEPVR